MGRIAAVLFGLALMLRLVWGLSQLERGLLHVSEGDYTLYEIGAEHLKEHGNFDNSLFLVRPPLFSTVLALLGSHRTRVIVLNAALGALMVPLTVLLARQLRLPDRVSLLAGLVVALDFAHIKYTAYLGPEAVSFAAALAMLCCLAAARDARRGRAAVGWAALAALMFCLSAYARPSIYLIWIGLAAWLWAVRPRTWYAALVFAVLCLAGVQVWAEHNGRAFGNRTFSTISAYTMAYYRAAAVLHQAEPGMSTDEAALEIGRRVERRLGRDPRTVDENTQHGYLAATPEVEQALVDTSIEIFRQYPQWTVVTLGVGVVRYFELLPPFPPARNLLMPRYYPLVLTHWALLLGALLGLALLARQKQWPAFWLLVLVMGYFTVGTLLVKSAGMTARERCVIIPLLAIAAAYGVVWLFERWQGAGRAEAVSTAPGG